MAGPGYDYDDDVPMKSMKGMPDRDVREDGVEHTLLSVDAELSELIDMVTRLENRMMPYLRPDEPQPTNPEAKDPGRARQPGSEIAERLRSQRAQISRLTKQIAVLCGRIDD